MCGTGPVVRGRLRAASLKQFHTPRLRDQLIVLPQHMPLLHCINDELTAEETTGPVSRPHY